MDNNALDISSKVKVLAFFFSSFFVSCCFAAEPKNKLINLPVLTF